MSPFIVSGKFRPMLIAVGVMILIVVGSTSVGSVAPPAKDVDLPDHVSAQQKLIEQSYQLSGIAMRLQALKADREERSKDGPLYAAATVSMSVPVLLGSYSDNANIFTAGQFQTQLFGANPTGSMSDYYDEVSYGQLNLTGTVYGPYPAANGQAYYEGGSNGMGTYPTNAAGFIKSILSVGDASIDFSQFDNDGPDGVPNSGDDDGVVDALIVVFPDGDASGGDSDNLWAHQWGLVYGSGSAFTTDDARSGGGNILIDTYTIQGAEKGDGTLNQIKPIGVYCHEFGHVLGLPDLYDYDDSSYGVGTWCLMGSGSWGANWNSSTEHRPTHMSAWCKVSLGWVTPTVVTGTQAVQIPPVETNAQIYKLWDDAYQGTRFFLLENRTRTGFDADIPGEGVLIWHCNEEVFFSNDDDTYRLIDLEEADGLAELDSKLDHMDAGDLFPGSSSNTSFADATNPPAHDVFGAVTGAVATGFSYGPGSDVSVTLTQRSLDGYTAYHKSPNAQLLGWGLASSVVSYGALRLNAVSGGDLVAVQAAVSSSNPVGYSVRVFNDMVGNSPSGLQTLTSGSFPNVATDRYHEIALPAPVSLSAGETFLVDVGWGPDTYAVPFVRSGTISLNSYGSIDGVSYSQWSDKDVAIRARILYSPMSAEDDDNSLVPQEFSLGQNYPNPFNPNTEITYNLPARSDVRITVFNLLGQAVKEIVNDNLPAGPHVASWDGRDESGTTVASGIYLYRLTAGDRTLSRKMVLLK